MLYLLLLLQNPMNGEISSSTQLLNCLNVENLSIPDLETTLSLFGKAKIQIIM